MLNVIVLILLIALSYAIFFLENERQVFNFSSPTLNANGISNDDFITKNYRVTTNETKPKGGLNNFKSDINVSPNTHLRNQSSVFDAKIVNANKELKSNLNLLEYIFNLEAPLADLASKDRCSLERLEEYLRLKKQVQLKIIELSQSITYYQSKKVNLC